MLKEEAIISALSIRNQTPAPFENWTSETSKKPCSSDALALKKSSQ